MKIQPKTSVHSLLNLFITFCICLFSTFTVKAQSCTSISFAKSFSYNWMSYGAFFEKTLDNGYLFGIVKDRRKKVITKVDKDANVIWSKSYDYVGASDYSGRFCSGKTDVDGNYFVDIDGEAIALLGPFGDIISMKHVSFPGFFLLHSVFIQELLVLQNNNKVILAQDYSGAQGEDNYLLICLSPDISTVLWTKQLKHFDTNLVNAFIFGDKIYVTGNSDNRGAIMSLNAANGNLINQTTYYTDNSSFTNINHVYKNDSGLLITGTTTTNGSQRFIARLKPDLTIVNLHRMTENTTINNSGISLIAEPDGGFFGAYNSVLGHTRFYISAQDVVKWSRLSLNANDGNATKFYKDADGLTLFSSNGSPDPINGIYSRNHTISRSDANGVFAGCVPINRNLEYDTFHFMQNTPTFEWRDTVLALLANATPIEDTVNYDLRSICAGTSICNSLTIHGPTNVCYTGPVVFTCTKNAQCKTPVDWKITGGNASIARLDDTTLTVTFLQQGTYVLTANLGNVCQAIKDSLTIVAASPSTSLDIGPKDSALCNNNSILLNAGSGFLNYLWQDGSVDSVYTVTQPGLYYVSATSACSLTYTDTINISGSPDTYLSAGSDRTKCNNDTLHLTATPGFINYYWSPAYNISSLTGSSVIIKPLVDTFYYVKAEKTIGCFGFDTVRIKVNFSQPVYLGNDTALCNGKSLVLKPQTSFADYLWSTGSSNASINISAAGIYWLKAKDQNNCVVTDTITVNVKDCLQGFYIPNSFTPNGDMKNDIFKPVIYGTIKVFDFTILDRYGETIFYTKNANNGWDGKYKGITQNTGAYTWICTYMIDQQMLTVEKGTVLLLR